MLDIQVPSPGESINEVEISNWLVEDGDYVEKDQEICEIDSDKATLTISAEESGKIKILKEAELTIPVGEIICRIDTSAKVAVKKPISPNKAPLTKQESVQNTDKIIASPAAKKIIRENNIEISSGTGKDGRITKQDVVKSKPAMRIAGGERNQTRKRLST